MTKTQFIDFHHDALIANALRTATFRRLMQLYPPQGSRKKLYDLGAGPCIFAKIAREAGYDVTAVDGRDERVPADLGSIRFIKNDVRKQDFSDGNVILALGLMYHLTLDDQIDLLSRVPDGALAIIDTQVHIANEVPDEGRGNLSGEISENGYRGVLYRENANAMASIGNPTSFIHTPDSQERLFEATGFNSVTRVRPHYRTKYGARIWYVLTKAVSSRGQVFAYAAGAGSASREP